MNSFFPMWRTTAMMVMVMIVTMVLVIAVMTIIMHVMMIIAFIEMTTTIRLMMPSLLMTTLCRNELCIFKVMMIGWNGDDYGR